jgi:hypothetical protein
MVSLALGTLLVLIPLTARRIGDSDVLPDRLATAEFIISVFIAMALVHRRRRFRNGK